MGENTKQGQTERVRVEYDDTGPEEAREEVMAKKEKWAEQNKILSS